MIRVRAAEVKQGHVVTVHFTDGGRRDIDFERFLQGPIFEEIRNNDARFRELRVDPDFGCIEWPNGADICPDVLYYDLPLATE